MLHTGKTNGWAAGIGCHSMNPNPEQFHIASPDVSHFQSRQSEQERELRISVLVFSSADDVVALPHIEPLCGTHT
jgi:hypothetical protein